MGSSNYITNIDGNVSQHMEYMPFGETLVDEHLNSNNSPFRFNAKELDEATGNYYYGARYYNPKWSTWLSVDPLFARHPAWSPYVYVRQNPINAIDPNGLTDYKVNTETGKVTRVGDKNDDPDRIVKTDSDGNVKRKGEGFLGFLVRKSERGKAKIAKEGISKGILEDGKSLKTESTVTNIDMNNKKQIQNYESSILKISNYLDVELGGYYMTGNKEGNDYAYLHKYSSNDEKSAGTAINLRNTDLKNKNVNNYRVKTRWHTHLSRFGPKARLSPSGQHDGSGDMKARKILKGPRPHLKFKIITNPNSFYY